MWTFGLWQLDFGPFDLNVVRIMDPGNCVENADVLRSGFWTLLVSWLVIDSCYNTRSMFAWSKEFLEAFSEMCKMLTCYVVLSVSSTKRDHMADINSLGTAILSSQAGLTFNGCLQPALLLTGQACQAGDRWVGEKVRGPLVIQTVFWGNA